MGKDNDDKLNSHNYCNGPKIMRQIINENDKKDPDGISSTEELWDELVDDDKGDEREK